jgi:hypothetical protein
MPTHWAPLPPKLGEELCCQKRSVLEASGACRYNQLDEPISAGHNIGSLSYRAGRRCRMSRRPLQQFPLSKDLTTADVQETRRHVKEDRNSLQSVCSCRAFAKLRGAQGPLEATISELGRCN